jgi:hypothetical protein
MDEYQVKSRVMFWHKEKGDKRIVGKFYNLGHIPRLNEQVYLREQKYRVINVLTTPEEDDGCDVDIDLEPII